jgi:purine-nucleoside phosphorylase
MGTARADKVTIGSVVVDMVAAANEKMVWRGSASQDLDPRASAEKKDKAVNKAIEKMFKNYPPKP